MKDMRAEFEAWIKKNYFNATQALTKIDDGRYYHYEAREKWEIWQAALSAVPAQEPAAWMAPSEPKSCNVITVEHKEHLSKVESWDGYEKEYAARFTVPLYFGNQQPAQEPAAPVQEPITKALIELLELWYRTRESGCLPLEVVRAHMALRVQQPVKQESKCDDGAACGVGGYCITCPNVPPVEVKE